MRIGLVFAIGAAALVAGCIEPAYPPTGPIELQPYPPPVIYRTAPGYRPPFAGPVPLQPAPTAEPLPSPTPIPDATISPDAPAPLPDSTTPPADDTGAIPLQDMPAPATEGSSPAASPAAGSAQSPATPVQKVPTSGPGSNVPLEGFRPMRGQTRPAS